jgi:manganese/zinc/iron transport system substrate-binding protein
LRTLFEDFEISSFARIESRRRFLSQAVLGGSVLVSGQVGCHSLLPSVGQRAGPRVVATTGMIADLVEWIGQGQIALTQLIGAGVDPHLYKPLRDDVVRVLDSDLVLYNGLFLEGRMSELLAQAGSAHRSVIALAETIPVESRLAELDTAVADPHVWMDVFMWSSVTRSIEQALSRLLPGEAEVLAQRSDDLRRKLEDLDHRGRDAISTIPSKQRILITSHDAFQYFGRRYGIEVQGVQGLSTTSEAGLQRIPELIELIIERSIPAVFRESSVAGKLIDAIVEGAAARRYRLNVGGELYSDALGPSGSGAESYFGMMEHNFKTIAEALGGRWIGSTQAGQRPPYDPRRINHPEV